LILLDTNILLRYARVADPAFATVDTAINTLHTSGETLCIVPQNVYGTETRTHLVYRDGNEEVETRTCVKDARSPCVVGLIRPSIIGTLSEAGPRDERFVPSQDLLLIASPSRRHHKVVLSQCSPELENPNWLALVRFNDDALERLEVSLLAKHVHPAHRPVQDLVYKASWRDSRCS
jgi:hypothetical protein